MSNRLPELTNEQLEDLIKVISKYLTILGARIVSQQESNQISPARELALEILKAGYRKN